MQGATPEFYAQQAGEFTVNATFQNPVKDQSVTMVYAGRPSTPSADYSPGRR